jgi:hypothetical protein
MCLILIEEEKSTNNGKIIKNNQIVLVSRDTKKR